MSVVHSRRSAVTATLSGRGAVTQMSLVRLAVMAFPA